MGMSEVDVLRLRENWLRLAENIRGLALRSFVRQLTRSEPRIKVLRGFRGVGKTTALLQLVDDNSAYFSMDNPIAEMNSLYETGAALARTGYSTLLIDEVQYYPHWRRDTKALYDEFPSLCIFASGSAPLAFEPERRYDVVEVNPLSLGEFVELKEKKETRVPDEYWRDKNKAVEFVAARPQLYEHYSNYLNGGGFPTFFSYKEKTLASIYNSIRKSIREDAPSFAKVDSETILAMEKTLSFIATSPPGEFNASNLSKLLEVKKHRAYTVTELLESMHILRRVRPCGQGAPFARGEPKLLFYHPNLRRAVCQALGKESNKGAEREELALFALSGRGWKASTIKGAKRTPDYLVQKNNETLIIEIGGPNKTTAQLREYKRQFKTTTIDDRQLMAMAAF